MSDIDTEIRKELAMHGTVPGPDMREGQVPVFTRSGDQRASIAVGSSFTTLQPLPGFPATISAIERGTHRDLITLDDGRRIIVEYPGTS